MASPDAFKSSPLRAIRHEQLHIESSSPDLPSLQDFLSQKSNRPPIRGSSRAAPIPVDTPTSFVSARDLWTSTELIRDIPETPTAATREALETNRNDSPTADTRVSAQPRDDEVVIVQITGKSSRKPRKPKPRKPAVQARKQSEQDATCLDTKLGGTSKEPCATAKRGSKSGDGPSEAKVEAKPQRRKRTGTMSNHFPPVAEPDPQKAEKNDVHEPLHLEQAPARRLDWTPPAQKTIINLDSDSSAFKQLPSSVVGQPMPNFKDLVEGYACQEVASEAEPQSVAATSDEDLGFLKKRKLIELVVTKETDLQAAAPEKSPTKKKAPKKKPRTITELATAAYKVPTQPDPAPPSTSILDHFQSANNNGDASAPEQKKKGKGKAPQRKRAPKVSKKKAPPPKPILLSPGAALAQVAKQDFVFGTSSQLAREESPTILRDLQAALRQPTQTNDTDFATPINSDAIEPPERRTSLWNAAARDAEGDLFDLEVINLTEDSPHLPEGRESNPFGYFMGQDQTANPADGTEIPASDGYDSFASWPDILPSPQRGVVRREAEGSPFFSDSDLSTSTRIKPLAPAQGTTIVQPSQSTSSELQKDAGLPSQPPRPNYEVLTDVQLAKEIRTFGFKPIKRRSAMIALLDQCWQSRARMGQASVHTSAKLSSAASNTTESHSCESAGVITKRPRGRPRKTSPSASEPQEPPPSAQPPETPKRRRGRPRKDSITSSIGADSPSKSKAVSSPKKTTTAPTPKQPRRRKPAANPVIEIPDSASDIESDLASSPSSSVEQMFSSPPPLDLSLSTNDDTELSLADSPNDQEAALFEHITRAIRAAPRTTDPTQPSWHEKILLYDPIVLEDLAAWLNTGELSRVGFDGEVSPHDVKKWCESKSVCCLWRVNLRGKERKRF